MKIAVTTQEGQIFGHFGKCKCFTIATVEEGQVKEKSLLDTSESGHDALVTLLAAENVKVLICGGIGQGARDGLASAGILVVPGVTGSVDEAINDFILGKQIGDANYTCNHHGHDHDHGCHSEGHTCHCGH